MDNPLAGEEGMLGILRKDGTRTLHVVFQEH